MVKNIDIQGFLNVYPTKTFKDLSTSHGDTGTPLVDSCVEAYEFDEISQHLLGDKKLASVDSIYVKSNTIYFIEFKTGFVREINDENFDMQEWECDNFPKLCSDGASYFKRYQKAHKKELVASLKMKLIESYVTFDKVIVPQCDNLNKTFNTRYIAVVDSVNEVPNDMFEDGLRELAGETVASNNHISSLKSSLKKYSLKNCSNESVFYDQVDVYTKEKFDKEFT